MAKLCQRGRNTAVDANNMPQLELKDNTQLQKMKMDWRANALCEQVFWQIQEQIFSTHVVWSFDNGIKEHTCFSCCTQS